MTEIGLLQLVWNTVVFAYSGRRTGAADGETHLPGVCNNCSWRVGCYTVWVVEWKRVARSEWKTLNVESARSRSWLECLYGERLITFQNPGRDKPAVGFPHAFLPLICRCSSACLVGDLSAFLAAVLACEAPYAMHIADAGVPNRRQSISFTAGMYCIIGSNVNLPNAFARPDM